MSFGNNIYFEEMVIFFKKLTNYAVDNGFLNGVPGHCMPFGK
jgi:hypothetical protein